MLLCDHQFAVVLLLVTYRDSLWSLVLGKKKTKVMCPRKQKKLIYFVMIAAIMMCLIHEIGRHVIQTNKTNINLVTKSPVIKSHSKSYS